MTTNAPVIYIGDKHSGGVNEVQNDPLSSQLPE